MIPLTMAQMIFLNQFMIILATIGFGFSIANLLIGISHIKYLKEFSLSEIKAHKLFGRLEILIFYILTVLCIIFGILPRVLDPAKFGEFSIATIFWHTIVGGIIAFILVTIKFIYAKFKKDEIYKYGKYIGPMGFLGWSFSYFTSVIDFYFFVEPNMGILAPIIFPNIYVSVGFSILMGVVLFVVVKMRKYKTGGAISKSNLHGVAMILHGITFGYEGSTKELVGTPVLYKYVFPKTYQFLERFAEKVGIDLEELKKLNLNDAMEKAMKKFSEIGMAEKVKINWLSENEFTVESVNCSTAAVRSFMRPDELKNTICPWSIISATIVNKLTDRDLEISPSEYTEIGSKTKLNILEKNDNNTF
ncbi:MAG: hypothetical protein GF329_05320 [Candidatus Lokiarchaeota archaeon]|nr:hypothetical protein [Candidatus Lokiarchaeota archaeon]